MSIRYFATNRNLENLARGRARGLRLKLQKKGYYWVNMQAYMSHYLATPDSSEMPENVVVSKPEVEIFGQNFLSHPNIKQVVICVHGFNVGFNDAQTWYGILTDTLRGTEAMKNQVVTDPKSDADAHLLKTGQPLSLTAFIGFSWPSNGNVLSYLSDQREAIASGSPLANLITRIRQETGKSVHLMCHSMGAFLACHMFKSLIRGEYEPKELKDLSRIARKEDKKKVALEKKFFVDRYLMLAPDVERRHVTKCVEDAAKLGQPDEKVTYLGQFYSGLEHLVGHIHNFYSRFDGALTISNIEKGPRKAVVATKGVLDSLTFGMLDFLERNPDEKWEHRLGATQHPMVAPPNMNSHNAVELSGREIGHSDYIDSQAIAERIAEVLTKP